MYHSDGLGVQCERGADRIPTVDVLSGVDPTAATRALPDLDIRIASGDPALTSSVLHIQSGTSCKHDAPVRGV
jgi:hypothetical protein